MIYIINENTNIITSFNVDDINLLAPIFRTLPNREATTQERDDYLLQLAKDNKIKEIEVAKKEFIYLPVQYNGSTFINSEIASTNLQGAFNFAEEPIEWLDIEGNTVVLTKVQISELANVMIAHRSLAYFKERDLKVLVKDALTTQDIDNIIVDFNG
jgi:hypothetical protein